MEKGITKADKTKVVPKKKRAWLRFIFTFLFISLIAMQFFQTEKNNNDVLVRNDISVVTHVPDTVQQLLKIACYDCHSNNTNYPWYTNVQPIGWWMKNHVDDGKKHLNFNEFANIEPRNGKTTLQRQIHKLEEVKEVIEEKEMPLSSYVWVHGEAKLTDLQKQMIINWADSSGKSLALRTVQVH